MDLFLPLFDTIHATPEPTASVSRKLFNQLVEKQKQTEEPPRTLKSDIKVYIVEGAAAQGHQH